MSAVPQAQGAQSAYLSVNNIEVIYDHVILVLKGVSLKVEKGGCRRGHRPVSCPSSSRAA